MSERLPDDLLVHLTEEQRLMLRRASRAGGFAYRGIELAECRKREVRLREWAAHSISAARGVLAILDDRSKP